MTSETLTELPVSSVERVKSHGWRDLGNIELPLNQSAHAFSKGECRVSISHPSRYPGWEEIKDARYSLLPAGLNFAMMLPPLNEYVNIHQNCFHLWEFDDK